MKPQPSILVESKIDFFSDHFVSAVCHCVSADTEGVYVHHIRLFAGRTPSPLHVHVCVINKESHSCSPKVIFLSHLYGFYWNGLYTRRKLCFAHRWLRGGGTLVHLFARLSFPPFHHKVNWKSRKVCWDFFKFS